MGHTIFQGMAFLTVLAIYVLVGPWWGAGALALVMAHDLIAWRLDRESPFPLDL